MPPTKAQLIARIKERSPSQKGLSSATKAKLQSLWDLLQASNARFDQLPVEVVERILHAVTDGKTLLALACTNKLLNSMLRDPHNQHFRRCSRGSIEAPANVTPRDKIRLTCANGCMHCGKPRVHKVYWPFLLRVCRKPCLEDLTISDYRLKTDYLVPNSMLANLPYTVGELYAPHVGSYTLQFYKRADVDRVLTSMGRPTLAAFDANRAHYLREAREAEEQRVQSNFQALTQRATAMLGGDVAALGEQRLDMLRTLAKQTTIPTDCIVRRTLDHMLQSAADVRCRGMSTLFEHSWIDQLGGGQAIFHMDHSQLRARVDQLARAEETRVEHNYQTLMQRATSILGGGDVQAALGAEHMRTLRSIAKRRRQPGKAALGNMLDTMLTHHVITRCKDLVEARWTAHHPDKERAMQQCTAASLRKMGGTVEVHRMDSDELQRRIQELVLAQRQAEEAARRAEEAARQAEEAARQAEEARVESKYQALVSRCKHLAQAHGVQYTINPHVLRILSRRITVPHDGILLAHVLPDQGKWDRVCIACGSNTAAMACPNMCCGACCRHAYGHAVERRY